MATLGEIVIYTLNSDDAMRINTRRDAAGRHLQEHRANDTGVVVHTGNGASAGQQFPLVVTRAWTPTTVNGQLLLDGNDTLWVTSASEGTGPGHWTPVGVTFDAELVSD